MTQAHARRAERRGIVLGAGGVLGFAWMLGALDALSEVEDWDPREAEVFVGTSAGSIMAAFLGSDVPVPALLDYQLGRPVEGLELDYDQDSTRALPPRPGLRMGSRPLLIRAARNPRRYPLPAALSSVLPLGRGSLDFVGDMVSAVAPRGSWASHPRTWIVAMDYESGHRTAFGRPGAPPSDLASAVMASCAIPAWYQPVEIGGRRYIDGGTCSSTSADLLAGLGLDEVFVLAPMVSFTYDHPTKVAAKLERRYRRTVTRRLLHEAAKVRRSGTRVTLLGPGAEDLSAIGANLMDARRRQTVLEVSRRTSREALASGQPGIAAAVG